MSKIKISMTIEKDIYDQFKKFCQENGMKISTKVEILMKETIKDKSLNSYIN